MLKKRTKRAAWTVRDSLGRNVPPSDACRHVRRFLQAAPRESSPAPVGAGLTVRLASGTASSLSRTGALGIAVSHLPP